jgi:hypothetical protein
MAFMHKMQAMIAIISRHYLTQAKIAQDAGHDCHYLTQVVTIIISRRS